MEDKCLSKDGLVAVNVNVAVGDIVSEIRMYVPRELLLGILSLVQNQVCPSKEVRQ